MAFLDNSGDIILDAVLTDTGRMRLARGDGSFKIAKYSFGDDEVNYATYNADNASGSAYYDLEILQTPILEAFTNNTATMKSKLITVSNNNLLYLPVLLLNNTAGSNFEPNSTTGIASGSFAILVDQDTLDSFGAGGASTAGDVGKFLNGLAPVGSNSTIRLDQGLDTTEIPASYKIDAELKESQYIVEMDNRFGSLTTPDGSNMATPAFIDDDNIASYYLSGTPYVDDTGKQDTNGTEAIAANGKIRGPRGTHVMFRIASSINLRSSDYLFTQLGSDSSFALGALANKTFRFIDTTIRVIGATTGYRVDVPVRYIKVY
jgi:hypothetical protein